MAFDLDKNKFVGAAEIAHVSHSTQQQSTPSNRGHNNSHRGSYRGQYRGQYRGFGRQHAGQAPQQQGGTFGQFNYGHPPPRPDLG